MVQHVSISNDQIHEPKDVNSAAANTTYVADGLGSGSWTTPKASANTVYVNLITDFPAAVSNTITLVADTNYVLGADLSTSDEFILAANNSITSNNINGAKLTYTGTNDMFTGVDVNFNAHDVSFDAPSANQVFNISELGGGNTKVVTMRTVGVISCLKYGTFNNLLSVDISDSNSLNCADGITVAGDGWLVFSLTKFALVSASATFIGVDFGNSVHQNVEMTNLVLVAPAGGIGIKGEASSANLAATNLATVSDSSFLNLITPLDTITVSDIRWEFKGNAGLADSAKAVDVYLNASTTVTIGTAGQYEPVGGTNFLSNTALRFTTDTAGICTYTSEIDACFLVNATATVSKVGGGANVLGVRIAKNGTDILASQAQTQSADPTSVSCVAIIELTKDDTISLEVANNDSTSNIVVDTAAIVITGVN